ADDAAYESDDLVGEAVTINRPRHELYAFWRDFSNLPRILENIESVTELDERRSHWVVRAPAGTTVEWDSVIVEDIEDELISWQSEPGADVTHGGRIDFRDAPGGRGTLVTVTIAYDPPAGAVGKMVAKLFQREPKVQARRDLRRFKQFMETGEIATSRMNDDSTSDASVDQAARAGTH
ncbi:MAG TPA: SRPBCC family protein, partial [Steroidobacteraceae bacterium]|nr:SRPBCC family protein [Steroidobacteraceae bacterium]